MDPTGPQRLSSVVVFDDDETGSRRSQGFLSSHGLRPRQRTSRRRPATHRRRRSFQKLHVAVQFEPVKHVATA
jgi:hypothetical protein